VLRFPLLDPSDALRLVLSKVTSKSGPRVFSLVDPPLRFFSSNAGKSPSGAILTQAPGPLREVPQNIFTFLGSLVRVPVLVDYSDGRFTNAVSRSLVDFLPGRPLLSFRSLVSLWMPLI